MLTSLLEMFAPKPLPTTFEVPTKCPACGHSIEMEGEFLICPNRVGCPAQVSGVIKTWIKKLGVLEWGEALLDALCEKGMISNIDDLYRLNVDQVASLKLTGKSVGKSNARRVIENLHGKKELPLPIFIGSLSIPLVARSMAKIIFQAGFDTLDKMRASSINEIASISGVGPTKAQNFVEGLRERRELIDSLLIVGIKIKPPRKSGGALNGKALCMSGFRDPKLIEAIEEAGGSLKGGVSKKLDYLILKDPGSTSEKAQKARQLGVRIVSPKEVWDLLG